MWWQIAETNGNIEAQSKIPELEERVMDGSVSVEEARKLAEMCIASSYKGTWQFGTVGGDSGKLLYNYI